MKKDATIEEVNKLNERCQQAIDEVSSPEKQKGFNDDRILIEILMDKTNHNETVTALWELLKEIKRLLPKPPTRKMRTHTGYTS
jgi:hypothetical protein